MKIGLLREPLGDLGNLAQRMLSSVLPDNEEESSKEA
jgi:hypothetical protein